MNEINESNVMAFLVANYKKGKLDYGNMSTTDKELLVHQIAQNVSGDANHKLTAIEHHVIVKTIRQFLNLKKVETTQGTTDTTGWFASLTTDLGDSLAKEVVEFNKTSKEAGTEASTTSFSLTEVLPLLAVVIVRFLYDRFIAKRTYKKAFIITAIYIVAFILAAFFANSLWMVLVIGVILATLTTIVMKRFNLI